MFGGRKAVRLTRAESITEDSTRCSCSSWCPFCLRMTAAAKMTRTVKKWKNVRLFSYLVYKTRTAKILYKSSSHPKILRTRRVTCWKFYAEDPQIVSFTVKKKVIRHNDLAPGISADIYDIRVYFNISFLKGVLVISAVTSHCIFYISLTYFSYVWNIM
jgi:thiol-disulfide isomerase/thioredoxin